MHELSICQALMNQVGAVATQHQATKVTSVTVHVGVLSGVEPELLAQAFTIARAGTIAEQAELITETLPIKVRCRQCGAETEASANRLLCAECGDWQTQLISGEELLLASVELEGI
ncbi:hydrogenase maturation nickel metallochaperone HypA [Candidatus Albibeggiatoa sp. nov. BB20]|uniref:hydrogenase maturation nickel metallochaperone HypA n=1 Tax=Candidatus Albibeggiatoa sp. nov. BB20 TaxID=3162723 RepID=UPI003365B1E5